MEKPATVLYKEFREKVINAMNESGLPAFVVRLELEQILSEVKQLEAQQYTADLAALKEEAQNDGSND